MLTDEEAERLIWEAVEEWRPLLERYAELARICEIVDQLLNPPVAYRTWTTYRTEVET